MEGNIRGFHRNRHRNRDINHSPSLLGKRMPDKPEMIQPPHPQTDLQPWSVRLCGHPSANDGGAFDHALENDRMGQALAGRDALMEPYDANCGLNTTSTQ
jgi:hypothetical protein